MSKSDFKISVIMPAFNDANYIGMSIESVLNQSHKNLELIIVDDGSKDDTVKIVKSISDGRIRLFINETNKGAAYSRNLAISKATGEYVAFLDADDLWYPKKIEKQLSFMIDNNYDFSCTDYDYTNENSELLRIKITGPLVVNHKQLVKMDTIGCLTVMYRRSMYADLSIPENIMRRNDYALWLKLSEKTQCYRLAETLSTYRKRKKSLSSINKIKLFNSQASMWKKVYGFCFIKAYFYAFRNSLNFLFKKKKYISAI